MNPLLEYVTYFVLLQRYITLFHGDPKARTLCVDVLNFGWEIFEAKQSNEFQQACALVLMQAAVEHAAVWLGEAA